MIGRKTSLNKLKKIEILPNIISDYNGMKLVINYRKKSGKNTNTWRLDNMLLKKPMGQQTKSKSENILRQMKIKCNFPEAILRGKFIAIQAYLKK